MTKWQNVCNQRQLESITFNHLLPVLDFLTTLYHQGLTYTAINTAQLYYIRGWEMCRKTRIIVQADEKHLPGKTSNTDVHGNLSCVYRSFIPSTPIPCGYIAPEGTYAETCCVNFISVGPKRPDRISENIDHMVFAKNYIFQLVRHLKQNRPVYRRLIWTFYLKFVNTKLDEGFVRLS